MLKSNRSRNPNQLRIGADLTPSQLVLAICVFLCAALICFSLGVIVGKYDERNSSRDKERVAMKPLPEQRALPAQAPGKPAGKPLDNMAKAAAGAEAKEAGVSGQGVQTSPRPIVVAPSPGKPGYPDSPGAGRGSVEGGPRLSEHPAPPKPASVGSSGGSGSAPAEPGGAGAGAAGAGTGPAGAPEPEKKAAAEPEKKPAAEAAPARAAKPGAEVKQGEGAGKPAAAESAKVEVAKAEPQPAEIKNEAGALEPVVAQAPSQAPAGVAAGGGGTGAAQASGGKKGLYTIQLAALTSATRKEQALTMKKKLEADGMAPELLISRDGARVSVVVGSYPDRQSAQSACNELRKNKGFSDCFVRTR